jgi:dihydrofolate synthase / folylpolyglutamate synthase
MDIKAIKTHRILPFRESLFEILDRYIISIPEKSILVITSKIVAVCEGRVIKNNEADKDEIIKREAELFLPPETNKYGFYLTIKGNSLTVNSGIDRSNGNGYFIYWPENPQKSANGVRRYLEKRFGLTHVGVVISDSKTTPLRWGETGTAIAHSGFQALNNYLKKSDIFGHKLQFKKVGVADGIAASAVLLMGEGNEQTPLAVVSDLPFVNFTGRDPSDEELKSFPINLDEDVYSKLLRSVEWKKGLSTNEDTLK